MSKKEKTGRCECGAAIHEQSKMCYSCSSKSRRPKLKKSIDSAGMEIHGALVLDIHMCEVYDLKTEIKLSRKFRFDYACKGCGERFETHAGREAKKKHAWHCRSCATSFEWENSVYRKTHVESIKKAKSTRESKDRHSKAQKKKWKDPVIREKMSSSLRKVWDSPEYRRNLSTSLKRRWKTNPPKCISRRFRIQSTRGKIVLRSSYERDFVRLMDTQGIEWQYEPKSFVLSSCEDRVLIPDFYLPDLDLWVEIKGYFWKDAKKKWEAFCQEYAQLNKTILFKEDLKNLVVGAKKIEDYA